MIINKIIINHFGKLNDFEMDFSDGFSMIYGENEQGKTTIMTFIRMMLYGTVNRSSDLSKNLRKKYLPWDGSKMGGSLIFTHDNQMFRIEKVFAATSKSDNVKLWNLTTNTEERLNETKDIGKRFLGLGETAFEKSVYIGQFGSVISGDKDDENEIIQKLQNLVSSGDETQSYNLVNSRLENAMNKILSKRAKIGILDKLKAKECELIEEKSIALECEKIKKEKQGISEKLISNRQILSERLTYISNQIEDIKKIKEYSELSSIIQKSNSLEKLLSKQSEYKALLSNGEFEVNVSFIDQASNLYLQCDKINSLTEMKKLDYENIKGLINDEKYLISNPITEEDFLSAGIKERELLKLTDEINTTHLKINAYEYEQKVVNSFLDNKNRIKNKIAQNKDRIEQLENEYNEAVLNSKTKDDNKTQNTRNKASLAYIAAATVLSACFLALGILIHPAMFIGLLLPSAIVLTFVTKRKKLKIEIDRNNQSNLDKINQIKSNYMERKSFYENDLKESLNELELLEKDYSSKSISNDIASELAQFNLNIEELCQNKTNCTDFLNIIYTKYGFQNFNEFQTRYLEQQNISSQKSNLLSEIEEKNKQYIASLNELKTKHEEFLLYVSKLRKVDSIDDGKILLDEITPLFYEAQSYKTSIEEKKKDLRISLNGMQIEAIREKYNELNKLFESDPERYEILVKSVNEQSDIIEEFEQIKLNISEIDLELTRIQTEMKHSFSDAPELSAVLDQIKLNQLMQNEYQYDYDTYKIANEVLFSSFTEMQQTFGPIVNSNTAEIFSHLTNSKYKELLVSKDLSIAFCDPGINMTLDCQYLSSGTLDQVYFSLRLAIAKFLSDQVGGLPLFLDDAFLQYDDLRAKNGIEFLEDYAKSTQSQILFFTCHMSMVDYCNEKTYKLK